MTPPQLRHVSRRGFLLGAAAVGAVSGCRSLNPLGGAHDPNLTAFLSDIHLSGVNADGSGVEGQHTYQNAIFDRLVDRILALSPLPARCVVMGDLALWVGRHQDYEAALDGFRRLERAGVRVHLTMGNHDHRESFLGVHPEYAKSSPVPGRIVSVVDLGTADLLLLDSLQETGAGEGQGNAVNGILDDAQWNWLEQEVKARKRPFFVGAHHTYCDLGRRSMRKLLAESPWCVGYIHGHDHEWSASWFRKSYTERHIVRVAGLPCGGYWGDIGFATLRTFADRAELTMAPDNDFFYPKPLEPGERRPAVWNEIVAEHRNASCTFIYGQLLNGRNT